MRTTFRTFRLNYKKLHLGSEFKTLIEYKKETTLIGCEVNYNNHCFSTISKLLSLSLSLCFFVFRIPCLVLMMIILNFNNSLVQHLTIFFSSLMILIFIFSHFLYPSLSLCFLISFPLFRVSWNFSFPSLEEVLSIRWIKNKNPENYLELTLPSSRFVWIKHA